MGLHGGWGKLWTRVVPAEMERVGEMKNCFGGRELTGCVMHKEVEERGVSCDSQDSVLRHRMHGGVRF